MFPARSRYLVAMGLSPAGMLTACNREATPASSTTPVGSYASARERPDAAPSDHTTAEEPSADITVRNIERTDAGNGVWHVVDRTPKLPSSVPTRPLPSCPSGTCCVRSPHTVGRAAPAPYVDCEASATPHGVGARPSFDADLTRSAWRLASNAGRRDDDVASRFIISDRNMETAWSSKTGELEGAWVEMHVSGSRSIKSLLMTVGMTKKPASPGDPDLFLANPRTEQIAPTLCTSMLGETVYMWPRVAARGWPARAFSVQHRDVSRGRHAFRLRDDIVDVGLRTATRY